jgi:hypothetical protein
MDGCRLAERRRDSMIEFMAALFFVLASAGILIGAYATQQIDVWLVAALAVMALWRLWDMDWRGK